MIKNLSQILLGSLLLCSIPFFRVYGSDIEELQAHVSKNPDDLKSIYQLSTALLKKNRPKEALKYLLHLRRKRPGKGSILYALSRAYYSLKRIPEALQVCSQVKDAENSPRCADLKAKSQKDFPDSYTLYRAQELFSKKEYEESMALLEELLSIEIENPHYRLLLGKIYHIRKQYDYAWDQYRIAQRTISESSELRKLTQRLRALGSKALDYVNQNKSSIKDEKKFYDRFYFALKLYLSDTRLRAGGFTSRAIEHLKTQAEDLDPFVYQYRLGYFNSQNSEADQAREAYQQALDEAPDDYLYTTVESLLADLERLAKKETKVIDLVSSVGGEDAYRMLQEAAIKANKLKRTEANSSTSSKGASIESKLGMDKEKFVAEFENYKRKIQNASSESEKNRLMQEMQSKYGHLFKDPSTRKQLESFLKTSEGKKLQDRYKDKIGEYKDVVEQYK
jgi:tetratricopeptide (TPR) repeat protein